MTLLPVLTLKQAAEYLQLTPDELKVELEKKRLPGVKIAGKWRVKREVLEKLFEPSQSVEASIQPPLVKKPLRVPARGRVGEGAEQTPVERVDVSDKKNKTSSSLEVTERQSASPESNASNQKSSLAGGKNGAASGRNVSQFQTPNPSSVSPQVVPAGNRLFQPPPRFRGKIYAYNPDQRFGYARLADNSVIWIDTQHFLNQSYIPQLGDQVSFEVEHTRKGRRARNICLVEDEKSLLAKVVTSGKKESTAPQVATYSPKKATPPHRSTTKPRRKKPLTPLPVPKQRPSRSGTFKAQKLYQKAAVARTEGRTNEARRFFRQALEAGAGTHMYEAFVKMLNDQGFKEEARQVIQQGLETFPDYPGFYVVYGQMERRRRNYTQAEEIFREGLKIVSTHRNLLMGLAQVLVQNGTEDNLQEAGRIYRRLDKRGQLHKGDPYYQRYIAFQRDPRAYKAYEFFQECQMRPGITGLRNLPKGITDLVVDVEIPELNESFGLVDAFVVRCFRYSPRQADLVELQRYLRGFGPQDILGVQDGRRFVINKSLAFIAVANSDSVRDHVMNIMAESDEAIIPLDDTQLQNLDDPIQVLRETLGQYLGSRDLYGGHLPVSGRRFFGREKLLRQLADQIQMGQFLGIYGLRKMGKTSLLYQLRDEKIREEAVAYVDLQKSAALSEKNCNPLYWELERDLYQRLSKPHPDLARLLRLGRSPRFSDLPDQGRRARLFFDEDVRALLDKIYEGEIPAIKRLVIILDELEWILPIGQERVEGYLEFFGLLRGLAQTERYRGLISSIVVAANASVSERGYWEGRENPVFAFYTSIMLPPFTFEECAEMICSLGKNMSVYWEDGSLDKIYSETGGHPFLTRLFCSHIVRLYSARPLHVSNQMVNDQLMPFITSENDKFAQITELLRKNFPEEERFLEQIALDETPSDLSDETLRHLLGYQLVRLEGQQYQITLNLLRRWLRRRAGVRD